MTRLSEELLADLEKSTVDWQDNYDGWSLSRRCCHQVPEPW